MTASPNRNPFVERDVDLIDKTDREALVLDHKTGRQVCLPLATCELSPTEDGHHHVAHLPASLVKELFHDHDAEV